MMWQLLHPKASPEHLGLLPGMLDARDPRPAREQLDENYQHGGGWRPFHGFVLNPDNSISYHGDPTHPPLAQTWLRDEQIVFYDYSWVCIIQKDRSFEICRMD
jgi:hypothetical protein